MLAANTRNVPEAVVKSCFRCGHDFPSDSGRIRICPTCRRPRIPRKPPDHAILLGRPLSVREKQIVSCVREAKLNKEIAYQLHLAEGTVKTFMSVIFSKVGVPNRTALAIWALRSEK